MIITLLPVSICQRLTGTRGSETPTPHQTEPHFCDLTAHHQQCVYTSPPPVDKQSTYPSSHQQPLTSPHSNHGLRKTRRARHQYHPNARGTSRLLTTARIASRGRVETYHNRCPALSTLTLCLQAQLLTKLRDIGRCDVPGEFGPPRCAHGHGARRPRSLQQVHDLQPEEP